MKEQEIEITNSILFDFQRYVRGEMTKREEFTFQKNIRKDLYAEAAIVGFTEIPEEDKSFFPTLAEEEQERKTRSRKRLIYSIIASLIILLIATSAYLVVEKKISVGEFKPFKHLKSAIPPIFPVITDSAQVAEFHATESMVQLTIPDIRDVPEIPVMVNSDQTGGTEILSTPADSETLNTAQADAVLISNPQINSETTSDVKVETGEMVSGTDNLTDSGPTGYVAPQPVNGDNDFSKYIEENIRKPQTLAEGENAVAVVSFVVKTTGNVDGIKVLSSPGEEYTTEAIRLIKEGPAWKPAENNGTAIEDEKQLRIVFK